MVDLKNCNLKELEVISQDKELFCFGAGQQVERLSESQIGFCIAKHIKYIIDNDIRKSGTIKCIDGINIPIISYKQFLEMKTENTVILITNMYYLDIVEQMDQEVILNNVPCYIDVFIEGEKNRETIKIIKGDKYKIPKTIHYCWFGGKDMPDILKQYIASWQKYCPDYEIIRHDESNYDVYQNKYMKQAYEQGKWAFVSDYARIDIIYKYGGIYLDTDVEIIKNLDDLLYDEMFCGFEEGNQINFGIGFGAVKGHYILKELLDLYNELSFIKADGSLDLTPCPVYQTRCLEKHGLSRNGKFHKLDKVTVYPREFFAPESFYGINSTYDDCTYSIHHYMASWFHKQKNKHEILKGNKELMDRMIRGNVKLL